MTAHSLSRYLQSLLDDRWHLSKAINRKPTLVDKLAEHFTQPSRFENLAKLRDDGLRTLEPHSQIRIAELCNELLDVHMSMIAGAVEAAKAGRDNIAGDAYMRHREVFNKVKLAARQAGVRLSLLDKSVEG